MIYGRSVRQLFVVWAVSLALVAGLYKVELTIPALHDMILPLYWLILGFTAFMTLRWLRARSPIDRRGGDRRRTERRTERPSEGES
jgi:hypothetical protein